MEGAQRVVNIRPIRIVFCNQVGSQKMKRDLSESVFLSSQILAFTLLVCGFCSVPSANAEAESAMKGKVTKQEAAEPKSEKETGAKSDKADKSENESPKGLSSESITKQLEKENKAGDLLKATATVQGTEVTIQTWTNPKSADKEKDSKIDSVLLSKKLLDLYPSITGFRYRYFDTTDQNRYMEITVVPGVVQSFAAGTLSDKDLLATLPTVWRTRQVESAPINPDSIVAVLAGPEQDRRQRALQAILVLEKAGVGAKPFRSLLATVEEAVKAGRNQEMQTNLDRLLSALSDQQRRLSTAKTVKAGAPSGVSANAAATSASAASAGSNAKSSDMKNMIKEGVSAHKKQMGEYYPHYGPLYVDRVNIANKLLALKQAGTNIDTFKEPFRQMEDTILYNRPGVEQSVRYFNSALKLSEPAHDADYKLQQMVADQSKGTDR